MFENTKSIFKKFFFAQEQPKQIQPYLILDLMSRRFGQDFEKQESTKNPEFDADRELETMRVFLNDYVYWLAQSLIENHGVEGAKRELAAWEKQTVLGELVSLKKEIVRNPRYVVLSPILDATAHYIEYMQSSAYKNHHKH